MKNQPSMGLRIIYRLLMTIADEATYHHGAPEVEHLKLDYLVGADRHPYTAGSSRT